MRGGYGIYHARILGQVFNSLTGIHTSDNVTFQNAFNASNRTYSIVWPNTYAGDASRGVTRVERRTSPPQTTLTTRIR